MSHMDNPPCSCCHSRSEDVTLDAVQSKPIKTLLEIHALLSSVETFIPIKMRVESLDPAHVEMLNEPLDKIHEVLKAFSKPL